MKLGICLNGCEANFEAALRERAKPGQPFTYAEIGIAHCETLKAVCSILESAGADWRAIGIDPSPESDASFEALRNGFLARCPRATLITATREDAFKNYTEVIGPALDFVFVDGCHAEPCVTGDFLAVEPLVPVGGLVVFHDCKENWGGFQPHCNAPAAVLQALLKLGLLDDSRPGWKRLPDWNGRDTPCAVFERHSF